MAWWCMDVVREFRGSATDGTLADAIGNGKENMP